jgi:histidyl-tRNA synthetase
VKFEAPRGTHDILPADSPTWDRVERTAEELCLAYGYRRITTPTFEDLGLFARTSGQGSDVVQKEMYAFRDRGDRELSLRPEATAGVARAYIEHGMKRLPQPVKTYSIGPMFRYAAPQKGRYREFWQINVEAMGSADPAVDAELIQLYDAFLRRLGIEGYRLELNSIGDRECRPAYVERLVAWLNEHDDELDADARAKREASPLRVFDTKNEAVAAALAGAPKIGESLCDDCREHFDAVQAYLGAYGVEFELAPTLVRGLDYYTRTAFEFVGEALGAQSSLCGGGRYDYLIEEIGGDPTPGVGWAAGIERILLSLEEEPPAPEVDVFFITGAGADRPAVLAEMMKLRARGFSAETDYAARSTKGQETHAARLGARHAFTIVGDQVLYYERGSGLQGPPDPPIRVAEIASWFLEQKPVSA